MKKTEAIKLKEQEIEQIKLDIKNLEKDLMKAEENTTKEAAQKLIQLLFKKFSGGGNWIKQVHRYGRKNFIAISPLGRVRHLWSYLHFDSGVWAAMDRRGPNSIVQGVASDIGVMSARRLRVLIWTIVQKNKLKFSYRATNIVHDSNKGYVHLIDLPLAIYLKEHAMTTQMHKRCRKVFRFRMGVNLGVDMEIGVTQAHLYKHDFTLHTTEVHNSKLAKPEDAGIGLFPIVKKALEDSEKELGYVYENKEEMLKVIQHNAEIIYTLRQKELEETISHAGATEHMLMTADTFRELGIITADQFERGDYNKKKLVGKYREEDYVQAA